MILQVFEEYSDHFYRLGVGGPLPKNVADGSFTKSAPTSNDKLLEQLIGKKRAKAHVAAQQQAARPVATQNTFGNNKTKIKKDDSEDEDEGRAAAFQSKRRKPNQKSKPQVTAAKGGDEDEDVSKPQTESNDVEDVLESSNEDAKNAANDEEDVSVTPNSKAMPSRTKVKPKSFLDEILAEKSSKKSRKAKNKAQAGP